MSLATLSSFKCNRLHGDAAQSTFREATEPGRRSSVGFAMSWIKGEISVDESA
jgi:hypothetical protein